MMLKLNQVAGQGENFNTMESTHFKFQNRIKQKKTDIGVLDRPSLSCTFSEAGKFVTIFQLNRQTTFSK